MKTIASLGIVLAIIALAIGAILFNGWILMLGIGIVHSFTTLGTLSFWPSTGLALCLFLLFGGSSIRKATQ